MESGITGDSASCVADPRSHHCTKAIGRAVSPDRGDKAGGVHRLGNRLKPEVEGNGDCHRLRPDDPLEHIEPGEQRGPRRIRMAAARSVDARINNDGLRRRNIVSNQPFRTTLEWRYERDKGEDLEWRIASLDIN